jgi:hypothetical protein
MVGDPEGPLEAGQGAEFQETDQRFEVAFGIQNGHGSTPPQRDSLSHASCMAHEFECGTHDFMQFALPRMSQWPAVFYPANGHARS